MIQTGPTRPHEEAAHGKVLTEQYGDDPLSREALEAIGRGILKMYEQIQWEMRGEKVDEDEVKDFVSFFFKHFDHANSHHKLISKCRSTDARRRDNRQANLGLVKATNHLPTHPSLQTQTILPDP